MSIFGDTFCPEKFPTCDGEVLGRLWINDYATPDGTIVCVGSRAAYGPCDGVMVGLNLEQAIDARDTLTRYIEQAQRVPEPECDYLVDCDGDYWAKGPGGWSMSTYSPEQAIANAADNSHPFDPQDFNFMLDNYGPLTPYTFQKTTVAGEPIGKVAA